MELKLEFIPLQILGYLSFKIPNEIYSELKSYCFNLLNNNFSGGSKANEALYSAIEHEYDLNKTETLQKLFDLIVPEYYKFTYKPNKKLKLLNCWINYQKKYEYNPMHRHNGELSFVLWISIPYSLEEEKKFASVSNSKKFKNSTTAFSFIYQNLIEESCPYDLTSKAINVDKSYEGTMILFPSLLNHQVFPFYTSDDYRISIAGNLIEHNSGN